MAAEQITYTNKTDSVVLGNPDNEKVSAADMNEIKSAVNTNAGLLDQSVIEQGTTTPIGNVTGQPGDLYKQIDTAGFSYTLWMHVGSISNDTDWQPITARVAGVLAGNNVLQTIPSLDGIQSPVAYPLVISQSLRISTPSPGVLEYTGPLVANTVRLHMITISGTKNGGGGSSGYNFILRRSPASGGGFVDIGFGTNVGADNVAASSCTIIATVIGAESGDQYQIFIEGLGHATGWNMETLEWVIY
jgi:hypothetical protein